MALILKRYRERTLEQLGKFLEAARLGGPTEACKRAVQDGLGADYKPLPKGDTCDTCHPAYAVRRT